MVNAFLCIFAILYGLSFSLLIASSYNKNFKKYGVFAKTTTSILFIVIAFIASLISKNNTMFLRMLPAFLLCLSGDIFLELNNKSEKGVFFIPGLASFLLGHIAFVVALNLVAPFNVLELIIPCVCVVVSFFLIKLDGMNVGKMKPYVLIYSFFVSWLLSKGIFVIISGIAPLGQSIVLFCGGLFFFISDFIILFLYFYKKKFRPLCFLNLLTYYIAQLLLALSIL